MHRARSIFISLQQPYHHLTTQSTLRPLEFHNIVEGRKYILCYPISALITALNNIIGQSFPLFSCKHVKPRQYPNRGAIRDPNGSIPRLANLLRKIQVDCPESYEDQVATPRIPSSQGCWKPIQQNRSRSWRERHADAVPRWRRAVPSMQRSKDPNHPNAFSRRPIVFSFFGCSQLN